MPKNVFKIVFLILFLFPACETRAQLEAVKVKTGAEVMIEKHLKDLEGKSVGLVMNPTARINDIHVLDTLLSLQIDIKALFAPEHGFRGDRGAGERIINGIDEETGLPVYSLYGATKKPTQEMLADIDIIIFDMQDVGARFYTYNTTMKYILESSAEFGKEVWILDRPNPAGGNYVAGWVLEEEFKSFVGAYPIPIAHGLTLGELATMAVGENWLDVEEAPNLRIIKSEGWLRSMRWNDTGLNWVPPSPNLPTFEHAFVYLGTCLFEGTSLSEGRGTENPFLTIGSPKTQIDENRLVGISEKYRVRIDTTSFIPASISGKALNPKYEDQRSQGVSISTTSRSKDPVKFGVELMKLLMDSTEGAEYKDYLFLLSGSRKILEPTDDIYWGESFEDYLLKREKYLLYK